MRELPGGDGTFLHNRKGLDNTVFRFVKANRTAHLRFEHSLYIMNFIFTRNYKNFEL